MKKLFISIAVTGMALAMGACGSKKDAADSNGSAANGEATEAVANAEDNTWIWDFPRDVKFDAKPGQYAFAYFDFEQNASTSEDMLKEWIHYYLVKIESVGDKKSTVEFRDKKHEIDNAFIIPIPEGETAKVGDYVLGYRPKAQNEMYRGYVTNASDPASPEVTIVDGGASKKDGNINIADMNTGNKLEPGTFFVLKEGEWMPGMSIVVTEDNEKKVATIINVSGDKVLALLDKENLRAYKRSDCKLMAVKPNIKPGDEITGLWAFTFQDGFKVKKFKDGFYLVEKYGDAVMSNFEVIKE